MRGPGAVRLPRMAFIFAGFALVFGTHLSLCIYYLNHGFMGADEGFYAIAARSVMDGRIPYRDFAYTQMPLLPYLNGLVMEIFGYTMATQRVINLVWSTIGLVAMILALRQRLGRWEPGLVAAFCVAASPHWAALQAIGTSHGAAGMFLSLSAAAVLSTFPHMRRVIAFALFATMAVGCRLSCAPVVIPLCFALALETRGRRRRLAALAIPLGTAVVVFLPFFLSAPRNMIFNVWEYHMGSSLNRRVLGNWIQWWQIAPAAIIVLAAGLTTVPKLIRNRGWTLLLLLLAGLIGVTVTMIPRSSYGLYIAPAVLVAAAAGIAAAWSTAQAKRSPFRHAVWLLPLLILYHDLPVTVDGQVEAGIVEAAEYLQENAPAGPILTPLPIVAVEAGRDVIPGTEMGMFCALHPKKRTLARSLRMTTVRDLTITVKKKIPAAIVLHRGGPNWNFRWIVPTLRRQPRKLHRRLIGAINTEYKRAWGNRTVWVYLRK